MAGRALFSRVRVWLVYLVFAYGRRASLGRDIGRNCRISSYLIKCELQVHHIIIVCVNGAIVAVGGARKVR